MGPGARGAVPRHAQAGRRVTESRRPRTTPAGLVRGRSRGLARRQSSPIDSAAARSAWSSFALSSGLQGRGDRRARTLLAGCAGVDVDVVSPEKERAVLVGAADRDGVGDDTAAALGDAGVKFVADGDHQGVLLSGGKRVGAARLLVIVSDGKYSRAEAEAGQQEIARLLRSGCGVLWLALGDATPIKGAHLVSLADPAQAVGVIGQAAVRALRSA